MSRKRKAPIRKIYPDPKYGSVIISKFINSIMFDGKRSTAEKILYDALDRIKSKNNNDPLDHSKIIHHSLNETKRKKLMNVLDDLVQLKNKLDTEK